MRGDKKSMHVLASYNQYNDIGNESLKIIHWIPGLGYIIRTTFLFLYFYIFICFYSFICFVFIEKISGTLLCIYDDM